MMSPSTTTSSSSSFASSISLLQGKEVVALLTWLESFPMFGEDILMQDQDSTVGGGASGTVDDNAMTDDVNVSELLASLDQPQCLNGVERVATEILKQQVVAPSSASAPASATATATATGIPDDNGNNNNSKNSRFWDILLEATQAKARPDGTDWPSIMQNLSASAAAAVVKVRCLANLLDCVINHPDLQERRKYIGRILKLPKTTQRRLMGMIEARLKQQQQQQQQLQLQLQQQRSTTPPRGGILKSECKYSNNTKMTTTAATTTTKTTTKTTTRTTPPEVRQQGSNLSPSSNSSARRKKQRFNSYTTTNTNASTSNNNVMSPISKLGSMADLAAAASPNNYTATPCYSAAKMPPLDLMSPTAVMDSPDTAQLWIVQLKNSNLELQEKVKELQTQIDSRKNEETNSRQEMIKLEHTYLSRQSEMEQQQADLQRDLRRATEELENERLRARETKQQYQRIQDEMELAAHSGQALAEAKERLRLYKERVEELQDVKNALEREQDAHSKAVEDVVRLQNELQTLQPLKRQLQDYKTRAIDAEVKLVEYQESLRRLELELCNADDLKSSLFRESKLQKEQLQEMVDRIQRETQQSIDAASSQAGAFAVGQGMSELNPAVKAELTRLRNENLQLRAFAAKRQDDAVEQLENLLDDARRLADKYKQEYFSCKDQLESTQAELRTTIKTSNEELERQKAEVRRLESRCLTTTEELEETKKDLDQTKLLLVQSQDAHQKVQGELQKVQTTLQEREARIRQHEQDFLQQQQELQRTQTELEESTKAFAVLQETADSWEQNAKAMEEEVLRGQDELEQADRDIEKLRQKLDEAASLQSDLDEQLGRAKEHNNELEEQFHQERLSNTRALEATKEILDAKYKQQLHEQSTQLNRLLDEERDHRQQVERDLCLSKESEARLTQELESTRNDSHSKINALEQEMRDKVSQLTDQLATTQKESDKKMTDMIRKGRGLIEQAKEQARQELHRMAEENEQLQNHLDHETNQRKALEEQFRQTTASLKRQLQSSTDKLVASEQNNDQLKDRIAKLKDQEKKLQEDNDRYRRQLGHGGGRGAGAVAGQYEKLQKEYKAVLEENRNLRRQKRMYGDCSNISETGATGTTTTTTGHYGGRGSGGGASTSLTQQRREFEEQLAALNDEKREWIMKHSAAMTDMQNAENRCFEREKEIATLKAQITSLELQLERGSITPLGVDAGRNNMMMLSSPSPETNENNNSIVNDRVMESSMSSVSSFYSASSMHMHPASNSGAVAASSPPYTPPRHSSTRTSAPGGGGIGLTPPRGPRTLRASRSPSIDRALREKEQHENLLRKQLSSLRRTPLALDKQSIGLAPSVTASSSCSSSLESENREDHQPCRATATVLSGSGGSQ